MTELEKLNKDIEENYLQKFEIVDKNQIISSEREQNTIDHMLSIFNGKVENKKILDIGCNFGLFSVMLTWMKAKCTGIDPNEKAIEIANRVKDYLGLKINYVLGKFTKEWLSKKKFNYIICTSCYHYLWGHFKNHDEIFKLFHGTGADIFFEDALDMTDYSCNEYFTKQFPTEKHLYTKELILDAAKKYFDLSYMGDHLNGTRHIYWMKREK